jgi:hypothetical protein
MFITVQVTHCNETLYVPSTMLNNYPELHVAALLHTLYPAAEKIYYVSPHVDKQLIP